MKSLFHPPKTALEYTFARPNLMDFSNYGAMEGVRTHIFRLAFIRRKCNANTQWDFPLAGKKFLCLMENAVMSVLVSFFYHTKINT